MFLSLAADCIILRWLFYQFYLHFLEVFFAWYIFVIFLCIHVYILSVVFKDFYDLFVKRIDAAALCAI